MAKTKPCWAKVTGPLAEYAAGFRDELFRLGYTPLTAACQLRLAAHLSRWMTAEGLAAQDLDMPAAERYFAARRWRDTRTSGPSRPSARCWAISAGSGRHRSRRRSRRRRPACCWTGSGPTWRPSGAWHRGRSR